MFKFIRLHRIFIKLRSFCLYICSRDFGKWYCYFVICFVLPVGSHRAIVPFSYRPKIKEIFRMHCSTADISIGEANS